MEEELRILKEQLPEPEDKSPGGVFFEYGSEEDEEEFIEMEERGWGGFINKIKSL